MNETDVLSDVARRLNEAGIAWMLTGSMAMVFYGQPRMTRDIDLVVALDSADAGKVTALFEDDYYVPRDTVARAVARRSMFNLIHQASVIKVDFIVLKSDAYRQEEFTRRSLVRLADADLWIVSREDLILSKLYWALDSKSEMQLRDVSNLLGAECDQNYLRSRAEILGVVELLNETLKSDE